MRLLKIGRDNSCDIVLHSDKVSSLHAEITLLDSGDMLLEDKGSSNGTFIMNQPVKPGKEIPIKRGDAIRFADVELQWSQIPMPEDNSAYNALYGIGKAFRNTIQLSGPTVSRYHATIKKGKNGKMYIIDHSKNGTTVDGNRISSNNPVRIKKKSAIVCGGVPVNLKNSPIQWPNQIWKPILAAVAGFLLLVGIGWGVWKSIKTDEKTNDQELYARYNHSVVLLMGIYHYEVHIGDFELSEINSIIAKNFGIQHIIPEKLLWDEERKRPIDISHFSQKDLIDATDKGGLYNATGFFISKDGKLITNLHVVKPWLFEDADKELYNFYSLKFAKIVEALNAVNKMTSLSALVSQLRVEGVLDYIALLPQGEIYDPDNILKCKVLSAGDEKEKDVALLQTITKRMPFAECTYVNVQDSLEIDENSLVVGNHMYTIGFPFGKTLQDLKSESGIQVLGHGGNITHISSEYKFGFDAASFHGASGSPIFNEKGMLIGVLTSGIDKSQGFNFGVKGKYVKELLENPHKQ